MAIKFFLLNNFIKLPERNRMKLFIAKIFVEEGFNLKSLTYIICSDEYLVEINKEFLGHDDYTDIISFVLSEPSDPIVGEIYISSERIKDNSKQLNLSIKEEVHRVIFHGALHLCGYKDKTKGSKELMTDAENKYLKMYFK